MTTTPEIVQLLAEHLRLTTLDFPFTCSCEPYTQDSTQSHREHVAALVTAFLAARGGNTDNTHRAQIAAVHQWINTHHCEWACQDELAAILDAAPAPTERRATPIADERFYVGLGIDQRRCAACATAPTLPCADHRDLEPCTGARDCPARLHEHGCYADHDGTACNDPDDHAPTDNQHNNELAELECTCGPDAFIANQCWHFDDCPRAAIDRAVVDGPTTPTQET